MTTSAIRLGTDVMAKDIRPTCSEPKIYLNMNPARVAPGTGGGSVAAGAMLKRMVSAHVDDIFH